ncbi:MAG TPA: glycine--tRNA ligase subunit beta [bacterium]|nr:glycine--tRNA ligase subunit beta [bacterium]
MPLELLVEIGCEEIPARFLGPALTQLAGKAAVALARARIRCGLIKTYGTPRRLTLAVDEVAEMQQRWEERKLGPGVAHAFDQNGEPTKAATGFARSCGVSVAELGREQTDKGERLLYVKKIEGRPSKEVLAEVIPALIKSLEFAKAMRWGEGEMAFVRPVHWILALLGEDAILFSLDGTASGRMTRGHRFLSPEPVAVTGIADYLEKLDLRGVVPDPQFRKEIIERDVELKAGELGGEMYPDPALMDEVTNLVEFPVVLSGGFDARHLALPAEVLIACLRTHQRYFALRKPGTDKELLPFFITVANTPATDLSVVIRGNERVLGARLADAEFYWREDLKTGIEKMRGNAAGMTFYQTLGSYLDKMGRIERLCGRLCDAIFPGDAGVKKAATEAARYCKADLVSQMVGEFAELQGVMGGEYARAAGMDAETARSVRDHYLPRSAEDIAAGTYPSDPAGEVVSLADKIDSVVSCWAAGLAPTGAGDPFALRRQAQGVIALCLIRGLRFRLDRMIEESAALSCPLTKADAGKVGAEVKEFFAARLKAQFMESGLPYDVVDAGLSVWNGDVPDTLAKIEAVARMKKRPDFDPLMIAFKRVMNIVEGAPGEVDQSRFKDEAEAVLYSEYTRVRHNIGPLLAAGSYDQALEYMAGLKPAVDRFFDQVMVNVPDQELRRNRHALCATVAGLFKGVADFSRIVIAGEKSGPAKS